MQNKITIDLVLLVVVVVVIVALPALVTIGISVVLTDSLGTIVEVVASSILGVVVVVVVVVVVDCESVEVTRAGLIAYTGQVACCAMPSLAPGRSNIRLIPTMNAAPRIVSYELSFSEIAKQYPLFDLYVYLSGVHVILFPDISNVIGGNLAREFTDQHFGDFFSSDKRIESN